MKKNLDISKFSTPYKIQLGPGAYWTKPDRHWINIDIEPSRGDIIMDFSDFKNFPLPTESVSCIYGSHIFEHISMFVTPTFFKECHRILLPGGILRLIIPDVRKSIKEYIAGNTKFSLFKRRITRAKKQYGLNYTLFDCLREDFIAMSRQTALGKRALAHQNSWDFSSIRNDLLTAGFPKVTQMKFKQSQTKNFSFEGSFPSEANQHNRSLYIEAKK